MRRVLQVMALAALVACTTEAVPRRSASPTRLTSASSTPPASASPTPHTSASPRPAVPLEVSAWFLADRGGQIWLAQELRTVPNGDRVPKAAVEEMLQGPRAKGLFSPFPRGTRVRSVTLDGPVATVDWDARVLAANVGAEVEAYGIQSVVYTLTDLPQIERVRFTVEGSDSGTASNGRPIEAWWGHVGLSTQPFPRDPTLRIFDASGH